MSRIKLAGIVAVFTVLLGGSSLVANPAQAGEWLDCNDTQIEYVQDAIRDECGAWGGSAWVTCDEWDVTFHSIECNVTPE